MAWHLSRRQAIAKNQWRPYFWRIKASSVLNMVIWNERPTRRDYFMIALWQKKCLTHYWPFVRWTTGHRWSSLTKGQPLQWRHSGRDSVSNRQPYDCLLNGLFRRRSKKTSKPRVTGLWARWPVNSPHKGPVMRKMIPFDDVIMNISFT